MQLTVHCLPEAAKLKFNKSVKSCRLAGLPTFPRYSPIYNTIQMSHHVFAHERCELSKMHLFDGDTMKLHIETIHGFCEVCNTNLVSQDVLWEHARLEACHWTFVCNTSWILHVKTYGLLSCG